MVAHIRHVYTDYDRLLKETSYPVARASVEQATLAKVIEWRGDDENGQKVLEDVFREVIVISDDEDSSTDEEDSPAPADREDSVEVISISNKARAEEPRLKPVRNDNASVHGFANDLSDEEAAPAVRIVPHTPKKSKINRRGFSRYEAWGRAINEYRNAVNQRNGPASIKDGHGGGVTLQQRSALVASQPRLREETRMVAAEPSGSRIFAPQPVAPFTLSTRENHSVWMDTSSSREVRRLRVSPFSLYCLNSQLLTSSLRHRMSHLVHRHHSRVARVLPIGPMPLVKDKGQYDSGRTMRGHCLMNPLKFRIW